VRDFIHVDDVAEATLLGAEYEGDVKVFNVGTGIGTSVRDLAGIISKTMAKPCMIEHLPPQVGEPSDSIADNSLAAAELQFLPKWTLQEKIAEVVEWNMRVLEGSHRL
jgi:UDP-glucose 4-epimerase